MITERLLRASLPSLRSVVEDLQPGECVACSIPLTGNPIARLWIYATLPLRRWWAERVFAGAGAEIVGRWGVDPDIDSPACMVRVPGEERRLTKDRERGGLNPLRGPLAAPAAQENCTADRRLRASDGPGRRDRREVTAGRA